MAWLKLYKYMLTRINDILLMMAHDYVRVIAWRLVELVAWIRWNSISSSQY